MAGEIQCPKLLRLQIDLPETSPALTQLKQGLGCARNLWGFNPSVNQSFLHLPRSEIAEYKAGVIAIQE